MQIFNQPSIIFYLLKLCLENKVIISPYMFTIRKNVYKAMKKGQYFKISM